MFNFFNRKKLSLSGFAITEAYQNLEMNGGELMVVIENTLVELRKENSSDVKRFLEIHLEYLLIAQRNRAGVRESISRYDQRDFVRTAK